MDRTKKIIIGTFIIATVNTISTILTVLMAAIFLTYPKESPNTVVLVFTMSTLIAMIASYINGLLTLYISKKTLIISGLAINFVGGMMFLFSSVSTPIIVLIIASGLFGIARGVLLPSSQSMLVDAVPPEKKNGILGKYMSLSSIGSIIMYSIVGYLAITRWQNAFLLFFILIPIIILAFIWLPNEKPIGKSSNMKTAETEEKSKEKFLLRSILMYIHQGILGVAMFQGLLWISVYVTTELAIGTTIQVATATSILTAGGLIGGLSVGFMSKIFKKWVATICLFVLSIGYICLVKLTGSIYGIYFGFFLLGLSIYMYLPVVISHVSTIVPRRYTGLSVSILTGTVALGQFFSNNIVSALCGFLGATTINAHYTVSLVIILVLALTTIPLYVLSKKEKTVTSYTR